MDKEELLAHANLKYPKGTKYNCNYGYATIQGELQFYNTTEQMITDGYGGAVLLGDIWAEIISYPEGFVFQEEYPIF